MFGKVTKKEIKKGVKGMLDRVSDLKGRAVYVFHRKRVNVRKTSLIMRNYCIFSPMVYVASP